MPRSFVHILLVLTLVLNGISAPWAMPRMDHAAHGDHAGSMHAFADADASVHAAHAHPPAHGDHAVTMASAAEHDSAAHDSCCKGGSCQCGCVLPPVVPLTARMPVWRNLSESPRLPAALQTASRRDKPPYRPPAV